MGWPEIRKSADAHVVAVSISETKGVPKQNIGEALLIPGHGLKDDAHAGSWHRQVSLLALESIEKMRESGFDVNPGDFAENITTSGISLKDLPVGTMMKVGAEVLLEVTQIGKTCHHGCAIFQRLGSCIMPVEGIFTRVLKGGTVRVGDPIALLGEDQG